MSYFSSSKSKVDIAFGEESGKSIVNKFGYNDDVDTAAAEVIASQGGTLNIMTSGVTLDISSDDANDTSAGTGARTVFIDGIDGSGDPQTEIVTLNGLTAVTTSNSWLGINRMFVLSFGSGGVNAGNITLFETAGTTTQAYIPAGASVTQQCFYHTPLGATLEIDFIFPRVYKLSGGGTPRVTIKGFSYSRVTGGTYEVFRTVIDTSVTQGEPINLDNPIAFGGREVIYFTATTDTNNTEVAMRFSGVQKL